MLTLKQIESILESHFETSYLSVQLQVIGGGDTHSSATLLLTGDEKLPEQLFAKFNSGQGAEVLKTEFDSLKIINKLAPELYPQPLLFHRVKDEAVLIMSFHNLVSLSASSSADAGQALAKQHKLSHDEFGWSNDNYIGLTPQSNQWMPSWSNFFREQRLLPMLSRAQAAGLSRVSASGVKRVISGLGDILCHTVVPSLVHGDLWSGNLSFDTDSVKPLLYDPAPYYGDREVDIAMTELFGRQADAFYQAYKEVWPLESGYEKRRATYNLYHALNHVVLFGPSYNGLVDGCLDQIEA